MPGRVGMRETYGEHPAQHGRLHVPAGDGPHPVVLLVHGGFWLARYGADLMRRWAGALGAGGYAVWNVEYRRVGDGGGWPATLDDVASATDHLAAVAEGDSLDLTRLVAVGHSAGGQLAVWLAARPGLPDGAPGCDPVVVPTGVVSQAGLLDLRAAAQMRLGGRSTQRFLGAEPDEAPERYVLASPIERVPIGVPMTAVHGSADGVVPPDQSRRFVTDASAAGDDAELVVVEGAGHFEHLDPSSELGTTTRAAIDRLAARP